MRVAARQVNDENRSHSSGCSKFSGAYSAFSIGTGASYRGVEQRQFVARADLGSGVVDPLGPRTTGRDIVGGPGVRTP